jgi:hypothetical protein
VADEPTLDPQQTARIASESAKASGAHRLFVGFAGVLVIGLIAGGIGLGIVTVAQRAAASAAQQLSQQVTDLGGTPVVQAPAPIVGPAGTPGQPGQNGKPGPGATQQQVDNAVFGYFAVHPPGATPAMVAVKVAAYLTAHPPKQGPPPTPAMIATAASDYIAAHAGDFQGAAGTNGSDGQPGQNVTDDQVIAAVSAYCDAHNQCAGPKGDQGVQGVSFTDLEFQRDDSGACMVVVTLHDPATGQDSTITHPAGDAACPLAATPTTTSSPPSGLLNLGGN